ncbi:MAG TPA: glycolate oxidase subunit GlcE [Nevskiaceae bacterium]|nr:glycolate oxidase subunit GlcE [Nevskiaceae bacterium]
MDATGKMRDRILAAARDGTPLRLRGGGTKDWYGRDLQGTVLDLRAHRGIVDYDPAELVITARGGTPLAEVEDALAQRGQWLAFEPPHFGEGATIGGCVASGLAGPRRATAGSPRDFVLGATVLDGRGQVLRFGGQVMKNVAGYDVARLMAGSLGTLGVVLDVSLKLLPRPPAEATLAFECDETAAIARMNTLAGQPLPVSATAWHAGALHVRLSGAVASVRKLCGTLGGRLVEPGEAAGFWTSLREQTHPFFDAARGPLWRCAVPSTTPPLAIGDTLIEWGGGQRWVRGDGARAAANRAGGHAVAFRFHADRAAAFDALPAPLLAIHQRLKAVFDPAGILNRGRLHAEL